MIEALEWTLMQDIPQHRPAVSVTPAAWPHSVDPEQASLNPRTLDAPKLVSFLRNL